jgi:hypothetical protein
VYLLVVQAFGDNAELGARLLAATADALADLTIRFDFEGGVAGGRLTRLRLLTVSLTPVRALSLPSALADSLAGDGIWSASDKHTHGQGADPATDRSPRRLLNEQFVEPVEPVNVSHDARLPECR